jgi:hypothetical protein
MEDARLSPAETQFLYDAESWDARQNEQKAWAAATPAAAIAKRPFNITGVGHDSFGE